MRHTPGPWTVGQTVGLRDTILSPQGGMIAKVLSKDTLMNHANAQLIAAAPEMLEALERITKLIESDNLIEQHGRLMGSYLDCIQAIEKAQGKS